MQKRTGFGTTTPAPSEKRGRHPPMRQSECKTHTRSRVDHPDMGGKTHNSMFVNLAIGFAPGSAVAPPERHKPAAISPLHCIANQQWGRGVRLSFPVFVTASPAELTSYCEYRAIRHWEEFESTTPKPFSPYGMPFCSVVHKRQPIMPASPGTTSETCRYRFFG